MNDQLQKLLSDIQEKTDNKFIGISESIVDIEDHIVGLFEELHLTQEEIEKIKKVVSEIDKTN